MTLSADLVEDAAAFEALEPAWWELWRGCPEATPFTSPAWMLPWWRAFAPGRLRCLTVWSGARLAALGPFWLEDGPSGTRLLPVGIGVSDGFDVLVHPSCRTEGCAELAAAASRLPGWKRWELEELPDDAAALGLPCPAGCEETRAAQSASPVLGLAGAGDPDDAVPPARRRKVRMARHRAERRGGVVTEAGPGEAEAFRLDLARLHGARWAARGEAGVLADPAVERFQAAALPALAAAGLARLHRLTMGDGQVAGAYLGLRHGRTAYAYLGGFDPAFAFESPGVVLLAHAIAEAGRSGSTTFSFLRGREPYKYEWGATDRWSVRRSFVREADRA